jgi:Ca2+/Na+ antiporter
MGCLAHLNKFLIALTALLFAVIAFSISVAFLSDHDKTVSVASGIVALLLFAVVVRLIRKTKYQHDWHNDPATEKQKAYARDLGIRFAENATKGQLSALIDAAVGKYDDENDT